LPAQASSFFRRPPNHSKQEKLSYTDLTPGDLWPSSTSHPRTFCDALHSNCDPWMASPQRRLLLAQLPNFDSPLGPKTTHINPQFPLRF
jgi:hypothetical protein